MYKVLRSTKSDVRFSLKHSKKHLSSNLYKKLIFYGSPLVVQIKGVVTPQFILFLMPIGIIKNNV